MCDRQEMLRECHSFTIIIRSNTSHSALFLFVPVTGEYGVIGLMEKYISFLGIEEVKMLPEGFLAIAKECGPFGFYTKQKVSGVWINGVDRTDCLKETDGLYQVTAKEETGRMVVTVTFL